MVSLLSFFARLGSLKESSGGKSAAVLH